MKSLGVLLVLLLVARCGTSNQTAGKIDPSSQAEEEKVAQVEPNKTQLEIAQDELGAARALAPESLTEILKHLDTAKTNCEGALESAKKENDPANNNAVEISKLLQTIKKEYDQKNKAKNKILSRVTKIQKAPLTQIEKSQEECTALAPYKEGVLEVKETCKSIEDNFLTALTKTGWDAFDHGKKTIAKKSFDTILKHFPEQKDAKEGVACLGILDYMAKNDFRTAYTTVVEMKKVAPESACVAKEEKIVVEKLVKYELKTAAGKEPNSNIKERLSAIDHYRFLIELPESTGDDKTAYNEKIAKVQMSVAETLIGRAKKVGVAKKERLPIVYSLMKTAYSFSPEIAMKNKEMFQTAFEYVQSKRDVHALLVIKAGTNPEHAPLENQIKGQFLTSAPAPATYKASVASNAILKLKDTKEFNRAPASQTEEVSKSDFTLWVKLLDYKFDEYGANQPSYKASRYVSGTRQLDNPEWFTAEQEFNAAQADYNRSYQYNQQMKANCNSSGNAFAVGLCQGMWDGLSSARVDNARNKYYATPRFIQENVISDYTYREYKVGMNLYIKVEEELVDNKTKKAMPPKVVEYKVIKKEGTIFEGVQPSDTNGVREGRFNVPDLNYEKSVGNRSIASSLEADLKNAADSDRGMRYCRTKGIKDEANKIASFELCRIYTQNPESFKEKPEFKDFQKAEADLVKYYQVSSDDIKKYAVSDNSPYDSSNPYIVDIK